MLNIDTETMLIELTRGDTANIVFSAVDDSGSVVAISDGDELKFSVAKKIGATPLFEIINVYDGDSEAFWTITINDENAWDKAAEVLGSQMKFSDYVWDVQLTRSTGVDTIIGRTDSLSPSFRVWGEVATETEE